MSATTVEQFSFPWDIPKQEGRAVRSVWEELRDMRATDSEVGGLIPMAIAAMLLDVCPQRVSQLVADDRLKRFDFFGRAYLSIEEVRALLDEDRKAGRPRKNPTFADAVAVVKASRKK